MEARRPALPGCDGRPSGRQAKVVEDRKGPKIHGFTYKNKSNQRKRWGHRQRLTLLEITGVSAGKA